MTDPNDDPGGTADPGGAMPVPASDEPETDLNYDEAHFADEPPGDVPDAPIQGPPD